jgi:hypothetical protein
MTHILSHDWAKLDDLLRELGAMRVEADDAKRRLTDDAVRDRIEQALCEAATAVDGTIDRISDREHLLSAWEQIVLARDAIAGLRAQSEHSRQIILDSVDLRERAEKLMREAEGRAALARALMVRKLGGDAP